MKPDWLGEKKRLNQEFEAAEQAVAELLNDPEPFGTDERTRDSLDRLHALDPQLSLKVNDLAGRIAQLAIDGFN